MKITRHNYEEYFLLYVDNELKTEERKVVEDFIRENADLGEELVNIRKAVLMADEDDAPTFDKRYLYKFVDQRDNPVVSFPVADKKMSTPLWKRGLSIAAALLLLASGAAIWFSHRYSSTEESVKAQVAVNTPAIQGAGPTQSAAVAPSSVTGAQSHSAGVGNPAQTTNDPTTAQAGTQIHTIQVPKINEVATTSKHDHPGASPMKLGVNAGKNATSAGSVNQPGTNSNGESVTTALTSTQELSPTGTAPLTLREKAAMASGANGVQTGTSAPDPGTGVINSNPNLSQAGIAKTTQTDKTVTNAPAVSYHTIEDQDDNNTGNKILFVRTDQVMNSGVKGLFRRAGRVLKHGTTLNTDNVHSETDADKQD